MLEGVTPGSVMWWPCDVELGPGLTLPPYSSPSLSDHSQSPPVFGLSRDHRKGRRGGQTGEGGALESSNQPALLVVS